MCARACEPCDCICSCTGCGAATGLLQIVRAALLWKALPSCGAAGLAKVRLPLCHAHAAVQVAGQDAAVRTAAGAVRLGRLGLQRGRRPLASFVLSGPRGVGRKTLCKVCAQRMRASGSR